MKKNPLLSIVIPTRNNREQLKYLLSLIEKQSYKNIEIIVSDGLSKDGTREIAKRANIRLINNTKLLAEPGVSIGIEKARGELIMVLAVDNYFYSEDDLEKIVKVFENQEVFAAFPKHDSKPHYSLYSKYINTFTDPFNHFVYGDAANARTFNRLYKQIEHTNLYDIYDFNSDVGKPILAFAQGFTVRRVFNREKDDELDDIAPILKLIQQNKQIAYVHSVSLYHDTVRDTKHFLRKIEWAASNALNNQNYGIAKRQNTLTKSQQIRKVLFPLYSFTLIIPIVVALYKAMTEKKTIWLFHPLISLVASFAILKQVIIKAVGFTGNISRL